MTAHSLPDLVGVYGVGGHGRETMPVARAVFGAQGVPAGALVFIDDFAQVTQCGGHRVLTFAQFLREPARQRGALLAVGDGRARAELARKLETAGVYPLSVRAANAVVLDEVSLGVGAVLSPFSAITSNCKIGKFFQANIYSSVSHDCEIGDYVTFAPGARCNGNVAIGDFVFVGAGAVIRHGSPRSPLRIGAGAVIGMGAVVTKDVPAGATVVGNPARLLER